MSRHLRAWPVSLAVSFLASPLWSSEPGDVRRGPTSSQRPWPTEHPDRELLDDDEPVPSTGDLLLGGRPDFEPLRVWVAGGSNMTARSGAVVSYAGETEGRLVYSNTLGHDLQTQRAGELLADDLTLNAASGCNLRRYSIEVSLQADRADIGGPVTVDLALFDTCPQAGGAFIPGTEASVSFSAEQVEENPLATIEVVVPAEADVPIANTVWLGVRFNRDNAGVALGAPPLVGFSADAINWSPYFCDGSLGGFPSAPYGAFNADLYVADDCPAAFAAYRNTNPLGTAYVAGEQVRVAEDIELPGQECDLIGFEIGVKGRAVYSVELRRDSHGLPGLPYADNYLFFVADDLPAVRFVTVDPPIRLAGTRPRLWMTVESSTAEGGWVMTGRNPMVGYTDTLFVHETSPFSNEWQSPRGLDPSVPPGFHVAVHCAGDAPMGACCDLYAVDDYGDAVCREVPQMNCPYPRPGSTLEPRWQEGSACEPDPFPQPCGVGTCCQPDDTCENLTFDDCMAGQPSPNPLSWSRGVYCESLRMSCPPYVCFERTGPCGIPRPVPGCDSIHCCANVCDTDTWCCDVEWDAVCVSRDCFPLVGDAEMGVGPFGLVASEAFPGDVRLRTGFAGTSEPQAPASRARLTPAPQSSPLVFKGFSIKQLNVDETGSNVIGDAANTTTIAADPTNPDRLVAAWRQFDDVTSEQREAAVVYSHDGGVTWSVPQKLDPGITRTMPSLAADGLGRFFLFSGNRDYEALCFIAYDVFASLDGGVTWQPPVDAYGGWTGWLAADPDPKREALYAMWYPSNCGWAGNVTRSLDAGQIFDWPVLGGIEWGTMTVGPDGTVYLAGGSQGTDRFLVRRSAGASDPAQRPSFSDKTVELGGRLVIHGNGVGPNPHGLLSRVWIAADHSAGPTRGNLYVVASLDPPGDDPMDVMFVRSEDGGDTWTRPVRVNGDPPHPDAWQWFSTVAVAPNGRIDLFWNDTRESLSANVSRLVYSYSLDGGRTWSAGRPITPAFDSWLGRPPAPLANFGHYQHAASDNAGVGIVFTASFNGEQDAYFLRIPFEEDCNGNKVPDQGDLSDGTSLDCNVNGVPDECEPDLDGDGVTNLCDEDRDGDGVMNALDRCPLTSVGVPVRGDGRPVADTDGDCEIDLDDYWRFGNCLVDGFGELPAPIEACLRVFDADGTSDLDLADFAAFQNACGQADRPISRE